jgi:hypothetical protein
MSSVDLSLFTHKNDDFLLHDEIRKQNYIIEWTKLRQTTESYHTSRKEMNISKYKKRVFREVGMTLSPISR